jgi:hypothetical protein
MWPMLPILADDIAGSRGSITDLHSQANLMIGVSVEDGLPCVVSTIDAECPAATLVQ